MRLLVASVAMVVAVAMLLPAAAPSALAQEASASPSASVAPSGSVEPSASVAPAFITLVPNSETVHLRTWSIEVTGGNSSVDNLEVDDLGSGFFVTVFGQSATVEMTLTLSPGLRLVGGCFHFEAQMEIDALVPPERLVLEVVPGHTYECAYQMESVEPPASTLPEARVTIFPLEAGTTEHGRHWHIDVTGGTPSASDVIINGDPGADPLLDARFTVGVSAPKATVVMTASLPAGLQLATGTCFEEASPAEHEALVAPRQLVLEVVQGVSYDCFYTIARTPTPTVPQTYSDAGAEPPSRAGGPTVLAALTSMLLAGLLIARLARKRSSERNS